MTRFKTLRLYFQWIWIFPKYEETFVSLYKNYTIFDESLSCKKCIDTCCNVIAVWAVPFPSVGFNLFIFEVGVCWFHLNLFNFLFLDLYAHVFYFSTCMPTPPPADPPPWLRRNSFFCRHHWSHQRRVKK